MTVSPVFFPKTSKSAHYASFSHCAPTFFLCFPGVGAVFPHSEIANSVPQLLVISALNSGVTCGIIAV